LFPSALDVDETFPAESEPIFDNAGNTLNLVGMERHFLVAALEKSAWNVTHAARLLGLSGDTLRYRMEKYSIRSKQQ
jgi:transcriptional regulator with GAF, ATPase, and Fis domain